MATYSLNDYTYSQKLRFYNSERRENVGGSNIWDYGKHYWDNANATLGQYTFDFFQDVTEPRLLCSFANGVTIAYTYDKSNQGIDPNTGNYWASIKTHLIDSDGIDITYYDIRLEWDYRHVNVAAGTAQFYYNPPSFDYNLEVGDNPINFISGGNFYVPSNYDLLHLGAIPDIHGYVRVDGVNGVGNTWGRADIYFGYTDFNAYMNAIIENGDDTPITPLLPEDDPSTPGGGAQADPDYNPYGDPVDFPGLPTGGSAIASGFIRVYNPTAGQLQSLSHKLWSNDFFNTIEKIMNDPMEAMISLHSVPFQIVGGANANIEIGNYDTEISARTVTTQYYTLDCGNISLPEHWASALDYSPYTTVDIFIPFVGVRPLQIDDVMNRVLNLKYNIDVLTGCAVAMLKCGDSVLYTYNTQVHAEIPYTMSSYGRLVQSIIGVAGTAIGGAAGGAGAIIGGAMGGALGTAMTKHSDISRGGSLGGAVGVMGDFTPYLIIHRPIQSLASGFASKKGYPSNITATLSSVSGYTVVDKIHLTGIDCTDTERDEIHALLKDGVII